MIPFVAPQLNFKDRRVKSLNRILLTQISSNELEIDRSTETMVNSLKMSFVLIQSGLSYLLHNLISKQISKAPFLRNNIFNFFIYKLRLEFFYKSVSHSFVT